MGVTRTMTTVIHDTTVVTGEENAPVHHGAAIAVDGAAIAAVGPTAEVLARFPDAERVSGRGRAVMPGFANCHTHFTLTKNRGITENSSYPEQESHPMPVRFPRSLPLSDEELTVLAQLGALEAIRCGTTAVMEVGANIDVYAREIVDSGLRFVLGEQASDRAHGDIGEPGPFVVDQELAEHGLQSIADMHAKWNGAEGGRVTVGVAAWAPDMCSPELLARLRELQDNLDTVATIHLNQLWGEVENVKANRGGALPTEFLAQIGYLNDRLVAAHCRCMVPQEERILGESGSWVSFNSAIAARRGLSPHVADLQAAGCGIAMGTDNMAEDMLEVVRTGMFMERVRRSDGRLPSPEEAFQWATSNGYRAMGIPDGGSLRVGNKADLIVVDTRRAHLVPTIRVVSTFVHQGQGRDVESVMVDGRWIMRDGRVLTMDEDALVREADRVGRRAWRRLLDSDPDFAIPAGFDFNVADPD